MGLSQILDFDSSSTLSQVAFEHRIKKSSPNVKRTFPSRSYLSIAVMDASQYEAMHLSVDAISFFCRTCDFCFEVIEIVGQMQIVQSRDVPFFEDLRNAARAIAETDWIDDRPRSARLLHDLYTLLNAPRATATTNKWAVIVSLHLPETVCAIAEKLWESEPTDSEVEDCVALLKCLAVDEETASVLSLQASSWAQFVSFSPVNALPLVECLYGQTLLSTPTPRVVVRNLLLCIAKENDVAISAIRFLQKLMRASPDLRKVIREEMLIQCKETLSPWWLEESVLVSLTNSPTPPVQGPLREHLETLKLFHFSCGELEPSEFATILESLFGKNFASYVFGIVTHSAVPLNFRAKYLLLFRLLGPLMFQSVGDTQRQIDEFVHLSIEDLRHLVLSVDKNPFFSPCSDAVSPSQSDNLSDTVAADVFEAVLPALTLSLHTLPDRMPEDVNLAVDLVCELSRRLFVQCDGVRAWKVAAHEFLQEANLTGFWGTSLWCEDSANLCATLKTTAQPQVTAQPLSKEGTQASRLREFLSRHFNDTIYPSSHRFASGAGIILKSRTTGLLFAKALIRSLRHTTKRTEAACVQIIRHLVSLGENEHDDSVFLQYECGGNTPQGHCFPTEDRQSEIARWAEPYSIIPRLVPLVSSDDDLLAASAVSCFVALLEGCHLKIQASFLEYVRAHVDERVFCTLKTRFGELCALLRSLDPSHKKELLASVTSCSQLLRLIQLLTEGHNTGLQDYFRLQPDNHVSVDIVESLATLLQACVTLAESAPVEVASLLLQLLSTMVDLVQGPCQGNQALFVAQDCGKWLCHFFEVKPRPFAELQQKLELQSITALLALLEGATRSSQISPLIASVKFAVLAAAIHESFEKFAAVGSGDTFFDDLSIGSNIVIFFRTCLDLQSDLSHRNNTNEEFTDFNNETLQTALSDSSHYSEVCKMVAMIEISRAGKLERCYFRIPSWTAKNLTDETKNQIIKDVKRDCDEERIASFFEMCREQIEELEHNAALYRIPLMGSIHAHYQRLDDFCLVLAAVINLILLITVRAQANLYEEVQSKQVRHALLGLGVIQAVLQGVLLFCVLFGPLRVRLHRLLGDRDASIFDFFACACFGQLWCRMIFFVTALLGVLHSHEWFSVQLLQVVVRSDQLYNVVLAVVQNGGSLLLTGCLFLIVVYIFSIVAFYNFSQYFDPFGQEGNGFVCDTLYHCTLVIMNVGLRRGGGIGDSLEPANYGNVWEGYSRLAYDFLFFVILIIIFMNIVFGIIVDSFADLRELRQFIEEDQTTKCFICGIERSSFDRAKPQGFFHHITFEHNMWQYLFFLHYLKLKPVEEHTGQESSVSQMVENNDYSFFPIRQAVALSTLSN